MAVDLLDLPSLRTNELRDEPKTSYVVLAEIIPRAQRCPHCSSVRVHGHGVKERRFPNTALHGKPTAGLD